MFVDYHMHTPLCGHAQGEMEEYIEEAIRQGLKEIAFSDHLPFVHLPADHPWHGRYAMRMEELPGYCEAVLKLRQKYPEIKIKLGVEADYIPNKEKELEELLSQHPFDFVLGSIHLIDDWPFDDPSLIDEYAHKDIDELWHRYFAIFISAVKSGLFDSMAHPDLIKKFGFFPRAGVQIHYENAAEALAEAQVCLEVNSAGLHKPVGEIYPAAAFLEDCLARGVAVTIGSDAHRPWEVARDFAKVKELLQETGCKELALFTGRRKTLHPLTF
ncbi:MAG: histidinol-phosphatase HisJ family protein [Limnochordia bacterium]|jgi:histidinol-phosphatase (PHP family)